MFIDDIKIDILSKKNDLNGIKIGSKYAFCNHCVYFDGKKRCLKYKMTTEPDLTCKSFYKKDKK